MYKFFLKPIFDFILALPAAIVLSPVFLFFALAIKLTSKGPVFFRQKRIGKNKKTFYIYKFRTMRNDTPKDIPTHLLENPEQYITKIGKLLRKTSLDELPQIFNILFGKMSIVGPRPALWNQQDLIDERDKYNVNSIRPGLTGWAQVNGRDELPIAVKARFDGEYIKRRSFFFDVKIFFMTFTKIFKSSGIVEGGTGMLEKKEAVSKAGGTSCSEAVCCDTKSDANNFCVECAESVDNQATVNIENNVTESADNIQIADSVDGGVAESGEIINSSVTESHEDITDALTAETGVIEEAKKIVGNGLKEKKQQEGESA